MGTWTDHTDESGRPPLFVAAGVAEAHAGELDDAWSPFEQLAQRMDPASLAQRWRGESIVQHCCRHGLERPLKCIAALSTRFPTVGENTPGQLLRPFADLFAGLCSCAEDTLRPTAGRGAAPLLTFLRHSASVKPRVENDAPLLVLATRYGHAELLELLLADSASAATSAGELPQQQRAQEEVATAIAVACAYRRDACLLLLLKAARGFSFSQAEKDTILQAASLWGNDTLLAQVLSTGNVTPDAMTDAVLLRLLSNEGASDAVPPLHSLILHTPGFAGSRRSKTCFMIALWKKCWPAAELLLIECHIPPPEWDFACVLCSQPRSDYTARRLHVLQPTAEPGVESFVKTIIRLGTVSGTASDAESAAHLLRHTSGWDVCLLLFALGAGAPLEADLSRVHIGEQVPVSPKRSGSDVLFSQRYSCGDPRVVLEQLRIPVRRRELSIAPNICLWACYEGNTFVLEKLMQPGFNPNFSYGTVTPLQVVCACGHAPAAALLLQHSARADTLALLRAIRMVAHAKNTHSFGGGRGRQQKYGFWPNVYVRTCTQGGCLDPRSVFVPRFHEVVALLLKSNTDVNSCCVMDSEGKEMTELFVGDGDSHVYSSELHRNAFSGILTETSPLVEACFAKDYVLVGALLAAGARCDAIQSAPGSTPFTMLHALFSECSSLVEPDSTYASIAMLLLEKGVDPTIAHPKSRWTPLSMASSLGLWDTAAVLLQHGADPCMFSPGTSLCFVEEAARAKDEHATEALRVALNSPAVASLSPVALLQRVLKEKIANRGKAKGCAMDRRKSCNKAQQEEILALLDASLGEDEQLPLLQSLSEQLSFSPLAHACLTGNMGALQILLSATDAVMWLRVPLTEELLFDVCWRGQTASLCELEAHCPAGATFTLNVQDRWGHSPLWYAAAGGSSACVDHLLQRGVPLNANSPDDNPVWAAVQFRHPAVAMQLIGKGAAYPLLTPLGSSAFLPGATIFHHAAFLGSMELIKAAGATYPFGIVDVNQPDSLGMTALDYSDSQGHSGISMYLKEHGARVKEHGSCSKECLSKESTAVLNAVCGVLARTPTTAAAATDDEEVDVVSRLVASGGCIDGAIVNAVASGRVGVARALLLAGRSSLPSAAVMCRAMRACLYSRNLPMLRLLLDQWGPVLKEDIKLAPVLLTTAIDAGAPDALRELLQLFPPSVVTMSTLAKPYEPSTHYVGYTVIDHAIHMGRLQEAKMLKERCPGVAEQDLCRSLRFCSDKVRATARELGLVAVNSDNAPAEEEDYTTSFEPIRHDDVPVECTWCGSTTAAYLCKQCMNGHCCAFVCLRCFREASARHAERSGHPWRDAEYRGCQRLSRRDVELLAVLGCQRDPVAVLANDKTTQSEVRERIDHHQLPSIVQELAAANLKIGLSVEWNSFAEDVVPALLVSLYGDVLLSPLLAALYRVAADERVGVSFAKIVAEVVIASAECHPDIELSGRRMLVPVLCNAVDHSCVVVPAFEEYMENLFHVGEFTAVHELTATLVNPLRSYAESKLSMLTQGRLDASTAMLPPPEHDTPAQRRERQARTRALAATRPVSVRVLWETFSVSGMQQLLTLRGCRALLDDTWDRAFDALAAAEPSPIVLTFSCLAPGDAEPAADFAVVHYVDGLCCQLSR
eukprot:TRINITY_DN3049_c0_g1_i2.p1 TRINITY_DN3049_c0_g1~~TRINITY_DN3049_c0_g1_i2.p1  ORF type:complete len:1637 (-),score=335.85 TRINITY_DN3049_c0_g1_i2:80-4990(-)